MTQKFGQSQNSKFLHSLYQWVNVHITLYISSSQEPLQSIGGRFLDFGSRNSKIGSKIRNERSFTAFICRPIFSKLNIIFFSIFITIARWPMFVKWASVLPGTILSNLKYLHINSQIYSEIFCRYFFRKKQKSPTTRWTNWARPLIWWVIIGWIIVCHVFLMCVCPRFIDILWSKSPSLRAFGSRSITDIPWWRRCCNHILMTSLL